MKWTALVLAMTLAAGPQAMAAVGPGDPWSEAFYAYAYHLQDEAFLLGVCERHADKDELEGLTSFLNRSSTNPLTAKMVTETQKAFEAGKAQADRRNWTAELCERALDDTRGEVAKWRGELERIGAAAGR